MFKKRVQNLKFGIWKMDFLNFLKYNAPSASLLAFYFASLLASYIASMLAPFHRRQKMLGGAKNV